MLAVRRQKGFVDAHDVLEGVLDRASKSRRKRRHGVVDQAKRDGARAEVDAVDRTRELEERGITALLDVVHALKHGREQLGVERT